MPPLFPINYRINLRNAYVEFFRKVSCKNSTSRVLGAYFPHLNLGKFCRWAVLAFPVLIPALFLHVLTVVFVGSEKQVVRVHTDGIVAFVADEHSGWNRTVGVNPRQPMALPSFSVLPIWVPESVSISILSAGPTPAFVWGFDFNFFPESFVGWSQVSLPPPCSSSASHKLILKSQNTA